MLCKTPSTFICLILATLSATSETIAGENKWAKDQYVKLHSATAEGGRWAQDQYAKLTGGEARACRQFDAEPPSLFQLKNALTHMREKHLSTLFNPEKPHFSPTGAAHFGQRVTYLKDRQGEIWLIKGGRSFDSGGNACARRAWNLRTLVDLGDALLVEGEHNNNNNVNLEPFKQHTSDSAYRLMRDLDQRMKDRIARSKTVRDLLTSLPAVVFKQVRDVNKSEKIAGVPFENEIQALRDLGRFVGRGHTVLAPEPVRSGRYFQGSNCDLVNPFDVDHLGNRCPPGTTVIFLQKEIVNSNSFFQELGYASYPELQKMMTAIKIAVKELHALGWIHDDLNANNILIADGPDSRPEEQTYVAHLIDFGTSKKIENMNKLTKSEFESLEKEQLDFLEKEVEDRDYREA